MNVVAGRAPLEGAFEQGLDGQLRRLVAIAALLAPTLHTATDVMEWLAGGFTTPQLWLNYLAFLAVPAMMVGLYAAQRPQAAWLGLFGALAYGCAFIYFAHTTLLALTLGMPTYEALWGHLGGTYTLHGALMVVGGAAFGWATLRAGVLPAWTAVVFLAGIATNFVLALLPLPDLLQTLGTLLRNAGLAAMGWALWSLDSSMER